MTDVLALAVQRREKLHDEIKELDAFIRQAETLLQSEGARAQTNMASAGMAMQPARSTRAPAETPAPAAERDVEEDEASDAEPVSTAAESTMQAVARRLSNSDYRRGADSSSGEAVDVPRPSIIRRGFSS